jgi:hypothetical protein
MSHSGRSDLTEEQERIINNILRKEQAGLQGEYPNGRLGAQDEGAVALAIGHEGGAVVIRFPKEVRWIGFTPAQAMEIAQELIKHARHINVSEVLTLKV